MVDDQVVLIIGERGDWSADAVADAVIETGTHVFRLTTHDFPQRMTLRANLLDRWSGVIATHDGELWLDRVYGVYYRRPRTFDLPEGMSQPERRFARAQARVGMGGLLSSLPARWVNHPSSLADAEYKPRQLAAARSSGLRTPETLLTNDPVAVLEFAAQLGELVVKPLAEPAVAEAGGLSMAYCRRMMPADYHDLSGVDLTVHQFQRWIDPQYAVRLTAVGGHLFTVAIHPQSEAARVDWRSDYDNLRYEVIDCPPGIAEAISSYLHTLGIAFGAFDFIVDRLGDWYFLECNPAGQWGWLADECDLPIAAAIAAELTGIRP